MVKNLNSTCAKAYLEQVTSNTVQINSDEIIKLLSLLNEFVIFLMVLLENGTQSL